MQRSDPVQQNVQQKNRTLKYIKIKINGSDTQWSPTYSLIAARLAW